MATLTKQKVSGLTGQTLTPVAASGGGDEFANDGSMLLYVKNADASSTTVTIASYKNCDQGVDHDLAVTVNAGQEKWIGPFPKARFDDTNGKVQITYSKVTSLTVAAVGLV